ncbi:hypothetical protein D3C76_1363270 [compost metagenome]
MIWCRPVTRLANLIAASSASLPLCVKKVMQSPRKPSGAISESLAASSVRRVLLTSKACISTSDCSRMACTTFGWQRPTLLTPTPADRSM